MSENNFIKSVEFQQNFHPFKGGDKIYFGGEKEIQNLIEFYLKSKGVKNYKKNAERFKINCVLGNNGGGKSRLFEGIIDESNYILSENNILNQSDKKLVIERNNNYECENKILLDDFSISNIIKKIESVNNSFLNNYKYGESTFFRELYEIYNKNNNIKEFLSIFLNINQDFSIILGVTEQLATNAIMDDIGDYNIIFDDILLKINDKIIREYLLKTVCNSYFERYKRDKHKSPKNINETIFEKIKEYKDEFVFVEQFMKNYKRLKNISEVNFEEYREELNKIPLLELGKIDNKNIEGTDFEIIYNCSETLLQYLFNINIYFIENNAKKKNFNNLSGGEKTMIIRFFNLFKELQFYNNNIISLKNKIKNTKGKAKINAITDLEDTKKRIFTILIDEPDLHLHLDWQKKYIQKLIDVFSTLDTNIKLHFIIATHSPFIISDLPVESLILLDGKGSKTNNTEYTKIWTYDKQKEHKDFDNLEKFENYYKNNYKGNKTFGANFVDLINDGFFFENEVLMGSFAESIIENIAEKRRNEITNNKEIEDIKNVENIEEQIGNEFLKDNLIYFKSNKGEK